MKKFVHLLPLSSILPIGFVLIENRWVKFIWTTIILLFLLKACSVIKNKFDGKPLPTGLGWIGYFFLWPGMRPESFFKKVKQTEPIGQIFVLGFLFFIVGIVCQLLLFLFWEQIAYPLRSYLGLAAILLTIHFGFSSILFVGHRFLGWKVEYLFNNPFLSESLRDFWSRRWNLAFVDMDKRIFLPLFSKGLAKPIVFLSIFLISGLLHELAISYPVNAGWGGPLLYFLIHGGLTYVEPKISLLKVNLLKKIWVWSSLLLPLPLLFHTPFLNQILDPYYILGNMALTSIALNDFLKWSLILAGLGHFLILIASFQVPKRLNWKKEFSSLGRFNKKIFWTYGGYIVFCIVSFGVVDLFNFEGLVELNRSSFFIALFIALFWTIRVIVDFSYFKHTDWPPGDEFVIGHTCLTALFVFLALVHWFLVLWQLQIW